MRQAGRSLPEYREVRKQCSSFLDLCYTPTLAAKVTLQPVERFSVDAAILFSDILVIPDAMGQKIGFKDEEGPFLSPLCLKEFQKVLSFRTFFKKLAPVYEAIELVKKKNIPLIGFAGAPWTLALYMLQGKGSKDFSAAKQEAFQNEKTFSNLLAYLEEAIFLHLREQVRSGVDGVQLFETWAGLCPATHFHPWIFAPMQRIVQNLRQEFPSLPIIGFPRGLGLNLFAYGKISGLSALSLDFSVPLSVITKEFPQHLVLQGNLDPSVLVAGGDVLARAVETIHCEMGEIPYIFNLGHGVLPQTSVHHIETCINLVRGLGRKEERDCA